MVQKSNAPALYIPGDMVLPDNDQWQFRFQIKSETSNRLYTISQNKKGKYWGCSCPAWITRKRCKHLSEMGIPNNMQPYDPKIINH